MHTSKQKRSCFGNTTKVEFPAAEFFHCCFQISLVKVGPHKVCEVKHRRTPTEKIRKALFAASARQRVHISALRSQRQSGCLRRISVIQTLGLQNADSTPNPDASSVLESLSETLIFGRSVGVPVH